MSKRKVLIVGGGGREHALAWKCAASPRVGEVLVAPGNAGTALEPGMRNIDVAADDIDNLARLAERETVDLTIVGPEAALAGGIVDHFQQRGLPCLGPGRKAAELEASKAFAKEFMARHGIPTADYGVFHEIDAAQAYIRRLGAPVVVKADGLAAGKGVSLAFSVAEAAAVARKMLADGFFGPAGGRIVVEEFLTGEEISFIALVDGRRVLPLATSQDHKAACDGDTGPNTGGMGAYSPAPIVTPALHKEIMRDIIQPTVAGMAAEDRPYRGFLYAGLMIGDDGCPRVLEYNVRLGDPETQPLVMRLQSDFVTLAEAAIRGGLNRISAGWDPRAALGVVMTAGGYPGSYRKGDVIAGLDGFAAPGVKVFHAGTELKGRKVFTSGGRVLCVCAMDDTVTRAQSRAYNAVEKFHWNNAYWRRDIGYRAVLREAKEN